MHALEEVLDEAREMLGTSIALPPKHAGRHPYGRAGGDFEAVPRPGPQMRMDLDDIAANVAKEDATLKVQRMCTLLVDLESRPPGSRDLDSQIHMRVTLDGGEVVYAISEDALYRSPAGWLEARLSREIARQLTQVLESMKKARAGRALSPWRYQGR
ncbi:hypothetical protein [Paracidovorax oryzae]|uniref:hypothetical protein n=1 Tax=Paracidovorax oryzae TaxID=862720 RepID=UPI00178C3037|nr:hypothetical protein [Paracidovorax oryzae]